MLGDSEDVALSDALRIVSGLIGGEIGHKDGWTLEDLATEGEIPRTNVRRAIRELKAKGEVTESGNGKRGDPYRYRPVDAFPAKQRAYRPETETGGVASLAGGAR